MKSSPRLLNYTTSISAEKTVAEIQTKLAKAGAHQILQEYSGGVISAVSFRIKTQFGDMAFRLPADIDKVHIVLQKQFRRGKFAEREQAARVGWRILKDWAEAQLALIETGMATIEQVFLPYWQGGSDGQTLYEVIRDRKFQPLLKDQTKKGNQ
jgi:hypothetical protein